MSWDTIVAAAVGIFPFGIGGIIAFATLRASHKSLEDDTGRRLKASDEDRKDLRNRIDALDREAVRRDDMERVEDKISKRLDTVDLTVRNSTAQIIGAVTAWLSRNPDVISNR